MFRAQKKIIGELIGALNFVHSPVNNLLCFNFINPLQNHYLFYQSLANIIHTLKITFVKKLCIMQDIGSEKNKINFIS